MTAAPICRKKSLHKLKASSLNNFTKPLSLAPSGLEKLPAMASPFSNMIRMEPAQRPMKSSPESFWRGGSKHLVIVCNGKINKRQGCCLTILGSLSIVSARSESYFHNSAIPLPKQPLSQPNSFYVSVCTTFWPPVERYRN